MTSNYCMQIIAHSHYMKGVNLKRKLKYTEKAAVVASHLLHVINYPIWKLPACNNLVFYKFATNLKTPWICNIFYLITAVNTL